MQRGLGSVVEVPGPETPLRRLDGSAYQSFACLVGDGDQHGDARLYVRLLRLTLGFLAALLLLLL